MATKAPTDYPSGSGNNQNVIDYVYEGELNRVPPDQAGAAAATAFLTGGGTVAQFRQAIATSPEAQAKIAGDYASILGRAPDAAGAQAFTQFLATADLNALYTTVYVSTIEISFPIYYPTIAFLLAHSPEGQADITAIYQAELGRAPDASGALAFTQALAGGDTTLAAIRSSIALSPEAQRDITQAYITELGRAPDMPGLLGNTVYLATGGTLAGLHAAFANSPEVVSDIDNAYTASGHLYGAPAVAVSAGRSELQSGIPFADLKAELGQLAGGPAPVDPAIVQITPDAVYVTDGASFAYSLLNNDALFSTKSIATVQVAFSAGGTATITGFNPVSDSLQFQSYQENSAGSITTSASGNNAVLTPNGGGSVTLVGVSAASLHASNFQFVAPS